MSDDPGRLLSFLELDFFVSPQAGYGPDLGLLPSLSIGHGLSRYSLNGVLVVDSKVADLIISNVS